MADQILSERQIALLTALGQSALISDNFYLTGGTPLAAFYLQHRYSEDLDFFSEQEVDVAALTSFFSQQKNALGIKKVDYQQSFNRNLFFLVFDNETVKTEFTYMPFKRIEKGANQYNLSVDSLLDIAVNKLFTIYQRTKARDYIDLYMITAAKGWSIADLTKRAKAKFDWHIDPLQLGKQFVAATQAPEMPRLIKPIDPSQWQNFFLEEAKKLKDQVLE